MDNEGLTQYTRIAISLAERIASGQLKEGEKLSGRSMSCPPTMPAAISTTSRIRPTYGENSSSSRNCWSVRNI